MSALRASQESGSFNVELAWFAFEAAMYSASTVDRAAVGCFFEDHETEPPATSNTKLPMDLRVSGSWA